MAAMRLGCLFSHPANIAVPAQGAVALQRELAGGAGRAGGGGRTPATSKTTSPRCWRRANCSASGSRNWASRYVPSSANFVLGRFGKRAIEVRDRLRDQAILVRDRSYEAAGCVRITVGTREQTRRLLAALEEIWNSMSKPLLVFDMDGVLVDVTESYRETHRADGASTSPGIDAQPRADSGLQEPGRVERRLEALAPHDARRPGVEVPFEDVKDHFQCVSSWVRTERRADPARTVGGARAGLFERARRAVSTSRSSPDVRRRKPRLTLNRFAPRV